MLVGELLEAYPWTIEYVLSMPTPRFYLMLRVARRLRLRNLSDLSDIAGIPACGTDYLKALKAVYIQQAREENGLVVEHQHPITTGPVTEKPGEEHQGEALLSMFRMRGAAG